MTLPSVTINTLDNQLGIVTIEGDTVAVIGHSPLGTLNLSVGFNRKSDVLATFGNCPMSHAICHLLQAGRTVIGVRTDKTTLGAYTAVVHAGAGTSVVTTDAGTEPNDDTETIVRIRTGGTIGVAGITLDWSVDGGRNFAPIVALGTATNFTIPLNNARVNFAAGTVLANQTESFRTTAPVPNGAQITAALDALRVSAKTYDLLLCEFPATAALAAVVSTALVAMANLGRELTALLSYRVPNIGESESTYLTAFSTEWGSYVDDRVAVGFGGAELLSELDQRTYLRRIAGDLALAAMVSRPGKDLAHKGDRSIDPRPSSVQIKDAFGNAKHHDEFTDPGADNVRGSTYRTWPGEPGVFIGNVRLMSTPGSDFQYLQHRRVINLGREIARRVMSDYSSADLLVDPKTGFLAEEEAGNIASEVNQELDLLVVTPRNASDAEFIVNTTDNILSTSLLRGTLRITPLAYAKTIEVDVGFYNPALKTRAPE